MAVTDIIILQPIEGVIVSVSINGAHGRAGVTGAVEDASPTNTARKTNSQYLLIREIWIFLLDILKKMLSCVLYFKSYRNSGMEYNSQALKQKAIL